MGCAGCSCTGFWFVFMFIQFFKTLQTKPAGSENMRSVFADLRPGRLRSAAASGSEHHGHKRDCPYRAQSTTKRITICLSITCQSGGWKWKRSERLHGGNRLRLALRRVCTGVLTERVVRIKNKNMRSCEQLFPPFTGSTACHSRDCSPTALRILLVCPSR